VLRIHYLVIRWREVTIPFTDAYFAPVTFVHTLLPKRNFQPLTLYNVSLYAFTVPLTAGRFITQANSCFSTHCSKPQHSCNLLCVKNLQTTPSRHTQTLYLIPCPGYVLSCFHLSEINYTLLLWFTKSVPYFCIWYDACVRAVSWF
jgi:hypothetical protein